MVHTFSPGLWDFAEYALYHTEEDPRETADVKARYPEVLRGCRRWRRNGWSARARRAESRLHGWALKMHSTACVLPGR